LHGEAVAIGMVMASDLSMRLGWLDAAEARRIKGLLETFGLPAAPPGNIPADAMRRAMGMDKKVLDGRLRLVLTRALGDAFVTDGFDHAALDATFSAIGKLCDG
jgi:3-dehydroquinate synthase